MTTKRTVSPDYPAISLAEAIERLRRLHQKIQSHPAPREVVAKGLGYQSLNGASMSMIAAIRKYGLLEKVAGNLKISQRGLHILFPASETERQQEVRAAALTPPLFAELYATYGGEYPDEDLLRNLLVRQGFLLSALPSVMSSFRDTISLVPRDSAGYTYGAELESEGDEEMPSAAAQDSAMAREYPMPESVARALRTPADSVKKPEGRRLFGYDFESGGSVEVTLVGSADTDEALAVVGEWIEMKRRELERKKASGKAAEKQEGEV